MISELVRDAIAKLRLKLLDLSNRNRLLNFKFSDSSRKFVRVIDEVPQLLFERLTGEAGASSKMYFSALPEPVFEEEVDPDETGVTKSLLSPEPSQSAPIQEASNGTSHGPRGQERRPTEKINLAEWAKKNAINPSYDLPSASTSSNHTDNKIQTLMMPGTLAAKMAKIRDDAKLSEQERGVSTLYAAFGFLEWYEDSTSKEARFAPLFLLPVQIDRDLKNHQYRYFVECGEASDPTSNISLKERLKRDFGLALPELGEDDGPEEYLSEVQSVVKEIPRWKVRRFVVIGHFSFARLVMYQDLAPEGWATTPLEDQTLIQNLLAGAEEGPDSSYAEDYDIEAPEVESLVPALPMDADSSQFSAIVDAMRGRSFALKGPPGTGKSQTITNLIAAALAAGKKVLFVAEKLAALEVVSKRLTDAGLGPFTLELHSTKSQKKQIFQSFEARLAISRPQSANFEALRDNLKDLARTRSELHHYAGLLNNTVGASDISLHDAFWHEQGCRRGLSEIEATLSSSKLSIDVAEQPPSAVADSRSALRQLLASMSLCTEANNGVVEHALYGLWGISMLPTEQGEIRAGLRSLAEALTSLLSVRARISTSLHVDIGDSIGSARRFCERIQSMPVPAEPRLELLAVSQDVNAATQLSAVLDAAEQALVLAEQLGRLISDPYDPIQSAVVYARGASELRDLGNALGWGNSPWTAIPRAIRAQEDGLQHEQSVLGRLTRWGGQIGLITPLGRDDIEALTRALALLRNTAPQILTLRHAALYKNDVSTVLQRAHQSEKELVAREAALGADANLTFKESPGELRTAAVTIEESSVWSRLFSRRYKDAVGFYRGIGRSKVSRALTPAQLRSWADVVQAHQEFASDPTLCGALGPAFVGVGSPFTAMAEVVEFWRAARVGWPSLDSDKAKVQHALLHGDQGSLEDASSSFSNEDLALLASVHDSLLKGKAGSAEQLIADQGRKLEKAEAKYRELAAISWTADPDVNQVASACSSLEMFAKLLDELQRSRIAALVAPNGRVVDKVAGERLRSTLVYAMAVQESGLPSPAKGLLLSPKCVQASAAFLQFASLVSQAIEKVTQCMQSLESKAGLNLDDWRRGGPDQSTSMEYHLDRARAAANAGPETFGDWAGLSEARDQLLTAGASDLCTAILRGEASPSNALQCFNRLYYRSLIHAVGERVPRFRNWTGTKMQELRARLVELDREFMKKSTSLLIRIIASTNVPIGVSRGPKKDLTERSLIENEVGKQTRHIPIRALMARAMGAAQALKPCFMMSPASVSQFLAQSPGKFDLVIIDEASQMRPEDALAALARTRQIVVVGDPMQLPPTTFFDSIQDEEAAGDDEDDLSVDTESILDLALSKLRPPRDLRWHYRSRHESLIAFSNKEFYQDRLIVFPSPVAKAANLGIRLVQVQDGLYRSSLNQKEAEAVIRTVQTLVHENPNRSIGVVAVNQPQRDLLADEFDRLFAEDEAMEQYRAKWSGTLEEFFVNNLENVQGHERDVIVISTVYGPEVADGPVFQRFGPINSKVGHRRLNVLFTRAKELVVLVTSMRPEDIKTTPTSPPGVHALKNYLEFARSGRLASGTSSGASYDSPFEAEVGEVLGQLGYRVVPQVGVAGFFIDLAVRHPEMLDHYVLGIECDGATYHSAKSARDRDRLRQDILERLGWRLHRIWSTDWYHSRDREIERLRRSVVVAIELANRAVH